MNQAPVHSTGSQASDVNGVVELEDLKTLDWEGCFDKPAIFCKDMTTTSKQTVCDLSSHKYDPVWDAQRDAITTYRCVSQPRNNRSKALGDDAPVELAQSLSCIADGAQALAQHLVSGQRFLMWIPIAYHVLASPAGRMGIANACRNLSPSLWPYLIFEIGNLPYGLPQSRLSELAGFLRPFCRGVAALLPASTHYSTYLGAGLYAIGLSLPSSGISSTEMGNELFKLGAAARMQHAMSFVFDVPQSDLLTLARESGISLLSGPSIGPPMDAPIPIKRLQIRDIVRKETARIVAARDALAAPKGI